MPPWWDGRGLMIGLKDLLWGGLIHHMEKDGGCTFYHNTLRI